MRLLPRILPDEAELDRRLDVEVEKDNAREPEPEASSSPPRALMLLVAAGALVPRLAYLFVFSNPQNAGHGFTDAYHHWQIAYLTREIGLSHGPRLWDLRGWEYYWGLMHPALMSVLFIATGSSDILLARLLSLAFGTAVVVLIFLLCHRYFGVQVALAAAAFAAISPASVFNDDAGMAEPIAIALVLFGIWLTPKHGFWAGVAWACSAMARVEAWLFAAGLVVAWLIGPRAGRSRLPLVAGFALAIGLYMKFLLDQTGNAIYPLYWSLQFVLFGVNAYASPAAAAPQLLRFTLDAAAVLCAAGLAWSLWKRPPAYLLLVYGFGHSVYSFATFLTVDDWKERRFEFPLDFAAILVAVLLFRVLPQRASSLRPVGWPAAVAGLLAVEVFWTPIQAAYASTESGYRDQVRLGRAIGAVYNRAEFRGGGFAVPGDEPTLVYTMVRDGRVPGDRLVSEFYDPFYYLPGGYHYADHKDVAGPLLQCWLSNSRIKLLLIPPYSSFDHSVVDYEAYIADHPDWFTDTGTQLGARWMLVGVQVPTPAPAVCSQAARDAPH